MYAGSTWLSLHTGWPVYVLVKAPVLVADLGVGWLLFSALRKRGHSLRIASMGVVLYLFNPLVLYNGALYGRFDAIALVFLLAALEYYETGWFAPFYALAIAAKTFPVFALPLLAFGRDRQTIRQLALALSLVLLLALPYVVTNPSGLVANLLHDTEQKTLGRLSWYSVLLVNHWLSLDQITSVAHVAVPAFPVLLLLVAHRPLHVKVAACFVLFLLLHRTVYEQYLLWPLPFLIIAGLHYRSRAALWLLGLYTFAGTVENETTWAPRHPFLGFHLPAYLPPHPWLALNVVLAVSGLAFFAAQAWSGHGKRLYLTQPAPNRQEEMVWQ
jgi:hypothetical protein